MAVWWVYECLFLELSSYLEFPSKILKVKRYSQLMSIFFKKKIIITLITKANSFIFFKTDSWYNFQTYNSMHVIKSNPSKRESLSTTEPWYKVTVKSRSRGFTNSPKQGDKWCLQKNYRQSATLANNRLGNSKAGDMAQGQRMHLAVWGEVLKLEVLLWCV